MKKIFLFSFSFVMFISVFAQKPMFSKITESVNNSIFTNSDIQNTDTTYVYITISVTTTTGLPPIGAEVCLVGIDSAYCVDSSYTGGFYLPVGSYVLNASCPGYYSIEIQYHFTSDMTIDLIFAEKRFPPRNVSIDPKTNILSWDKPRFICIREDFRTSYFPPDGWQSFANGSVSWFNTEDGSAGNFIIPEHNSQYACVNDSLNSGDNGFLVTPLLLLDEYEGYYLTFDSYYDGHGEMATIEYSLDTGSNWFVLNELVPAAEWQYVQIDLSEFCGYSALPLYLGFRGKQWAIDNVEVSVVYDSIPNYQEFWVYLDDEHVATTQETNYQFKNIYYGEEHNVALAALYSSGLSDKIYIDFTSEFLYPPNALAGISFDNCVQLLWYPPLMPDTSGDFSRDIWDLQFTFPLAAYGNEYGCETDGNYFYTTQHNGSNFYRYEMNGTFVGSFTISGVSNIKDLAYDGEYFYGGSALSTCYIMDFDDETLVGTINAHVAIRAIAYDNTFDAFWTNNWSNDITLFNKGGIQLNSFSCGTYNNYWGFAYDDFTDGGPFLWGFSSDGSGAIIVQIETATGQETGFTFDVHVATGGTHPPGGLFTHPDIVPGKWTIGGVLQNELLFGFDLGDYSGGGGTGIVPDNLLGYNVYRNDEFREYIEYDGGDSTLWYDYDLYPGNYKYEVTALYDMDVYGLPGDTAESAPDGPVIMTCIIPVILPFEEGWVYGSFETYMWEVESGAWVIDMAKGNPEPSASFVGDSAFVDYNTGLISTQIYGIDITDGDIFLDFDVKLEDIQATATEKFTIKIWDGNEWFGIDTIVNNGSTDWMEYHYNINEYAKGNNFRIGFFANGENSSNIDAWYLDNIHVYRLCAAPQELTVEAVYYPNYTEVILNWLTSGIGNDQWLYYNDKSFENAISSINTGEGLAQLFTPTYYPSTITKVKFFVGDHLNYTGDVEVYILSGDGTSVLSGPYTVHASEPDSWVVVDVDNITIEEGNFIVATFNSSAEGPFIGVDDSKFDSTLYFGSIGNFTQLGEFGYRFVGSHEVYVEQFAGDNIVQNSTNLKPRSIHKKPEINLSNKYSDGSDDREVKDFLGFNIFRNSEKIEELYTETEYHDTLTQAGEYTYFIEAIYDQCMSDSSNNVTIILYTNIENIETSDQIKIYPNPTNDHLIIELNTVPAENLKVKIFDINGHVVESMILNSSTVKNTINLSNLNSGVYFINVSSKEFQRTEKLLIF